MNQRRLLAFGVVLAFSAAVAPAAKKPIVDGERLEFELPDLDGTVVSSNDTRFAGKVLLIDLWATWCPPCITEIPTLIDLQDRYRDAGLVIVAIAFEREQQADLRRARLMEFAAQRGINYLVLDGGPPEDFERAMPSVKNVRGLPVEILVDRNGSVAAARIGYGYKKKWAARLERDIAELLRLSKP